MKLNNTDQENLNFKKISFDREMATQQHWYFLLIYLSFAFFSCFFAMV